MQGLIFEEFLEAVDAGLAAVAGLLEAAERRVQVERAAVHVHLPGADAARDALRVRGYIKKGVDEGAQLIAGGAEPPEGAPAGGYYVRPTVFGKVKNSMTIAQEEIFGPVLSIIPYKDEDEAVRIANDSPYGLAGAVWSKDESRAQRVARRIRAGQVDVNGGAFNMNAPLGGFKQSGHGREAGVYGLEEFLEYKSLQLKG